MAGKVLLVDDVKFFLDLGKSYLYRTDCEVFTATNGKEALDVAKKILPNVVFLDYEMPEMNGLDFLQAKKDITEIKDVPVVIVSSFIDKSLEGTLIQNGAKEVIKKPFTEETFLSLANKYLNFDKRKKRRIIIDVPAFFGFEDDMEKGMILDLSEGGLFLAAERLLKEGAYLELKFLLPNTNVSLKLWCRVVWTNKEGCKRKESYPVGMGLEFVGLSKDTIEILRSFIEKQTNGY